MTTFSILWQEEFWLRGIALIAFFSALWHILNNRDKKILMFLRGMAVLCLILAALRPIILLKESILERPKILLLIDRGHSMGGTAEKTTRLKSVENWLSQNASTLNSKVDLSIFALSGNSREIPTLKKVSNLTISETDFAPETTFAATIQQLGNFQAQRAWLFSDGNTAGEDLRTALLSLKIPVDAVAEGSDLRRKGLSFKEIHSPDFAFLHGRFSFSITVKTSKLKNQTILLSLLKKSESSPSKWNVVEKKSVTTRSNFDVISTSFTAVAEHLGAENYRLEAQAADVAPAVREIILPVVRQKYRIMFLAGRPSFEYAFLRHFIKKDPRRELVSFVILRNPQNPVIVPDQELSLIPFPAQNIFLRDISQFDLFILENFSAQKFNLPPAYLESLKRYVGAGGALLVLGGNNAFSEGGYKGTALEDLLPVSLSKTIPDFNPSLFRPVPVSIRHPLTNLYATENESAKAWANLPPLKGYGLFSALKPDGVPILNNPSEKMLSGQTLPIIAVKKFGQGRVMVISTDSLWRWKLGLAQNKAISDFYDRFWSRAIEYLTGTLNLSKVKFSPIADQINAVEPARFFFNVFDQNFSPMPPDKITLSVKWKTPSGKTHPVAYHIMQTGYYEVDLTGISAGVNELTVSAYKNEGLWGKDSIRFNWRPSDNQTPVERSALKLAAESTGGKFFELSKISANDLLNNLPPPIKRYETSKIYNPCASPLWLALCAFLFILEWILRRKRGLA